MSVPVYQKIKAALRKDISNGKYKSGDKIPSVNELAKIFDTSRNTAVKAVNDLVIDGDVYTVQGKGTIVGKQSPVSKNSRPNTGILQIGILFSDYDRLDSPYFTKLLKGISREANKTACQLKSFCVKGKDVSELLKNEYFDGLIIATRLPVESVMLLKKHNAAFVLVGNDVYGEKLLCVSGDAYKATCDALKYLASLGHKDIALLSGPADAHSTPALYHAYKNIMNELGLSFDEELFKSCDWGEEGGYEGFMKLWQEGKKPSAVYASEDDMALGVMRAAEELSLKVPEELSIIGHGNRYSTVNMKIPLTTFEDKLDQIGAKSLEMLCNKIKNKNIKTQKVILESDLIIRNSCKKIN